MKNLKTYIIYIYIYVNHFAVHLKLTQYFLSTMLQFKKNDKAKCWQGFRATRNFLHLIHLYLCDCTVVQSFCKTLSVPYKLVMIYLSYNTGILLLGILFILKNEGAYLQKYC